MKVIYNVKDNNAHDFKTVISRSKKMKMPGPESLGIIVGGGDYPYEKSLSPSIA